MGEREGEGGREGEREGEEGGRGGREGEEGGMGGEREGGREGGGGGVSQVSESSHISLLLTLFSANCLHKVRLKMSS